MNKNGFTLIEVLIALLIMATVLSPVFVLQTNVMRVVGRFSQLIARIMQANNFLITTQIIDHPKATKFEKEITVEDPDSKLIYEIEPVSKKSALKNFKNLFRQEVLISWQGPILQQKDTLVSFVFKKPQKSEKE